MNDTALATPPRKFVDPDRTADGKHRARVPLARLTTLWINTGCGKIGDPAIPVIPQPLPVQDLSVSVDIDGVTLSWAPPTVYSNQKQLDLDDIKTFTIVRKTEAPSTNNWDFSQSSRGWTAVGRTFPVKLHKGVLRTASEQKFLFIRSQDDLSIPAETYRYLQLKLWTQNSQQGYIAFTTTSDSTWDTDVDLTFQPAVHTSYYTFQQVLFTNQAQKTMKNSYSLLKPSNTFCHLLAPSSTSCHLLHTPSSKNQKVFANNSNVENSVDYQTNDYQTNDYKTTRLNYEPSRHQLRQFFH